MPSSRTATAPAERDGGPRPGSLASLPRRTYRFRVLGMGLAFLPLAAVMHELDAHWSVWAWIVFGGLLWPHLAYLRATRSRDPFVAELRNFVFDSFMAGSWAPLMHFNLLPTAVLLTVVTADKVNTGIRKLWLRSLPWTALAILGGGLITGFAFRPQTSTTVLLACLPILVVHTLAVSLSSYRLVRRVQRQNVQLEAISRTDALTGLDSRRHWETQAQALLEAGGEASLLLVDVDHFKQVNDRHGHAAGDDVLGGILALIREVLPQPHHAGRLGGDEFVVALALPLAEARACAERLAAAVRDWRPPREAPLRCSVSIGVAAAPTSGTSLREWLELADRALYEAKHAGRDRSHALAMAAPRARD